MMEAREARREDEEAGANEVCPTCQTQDGAIFLSPAIDLGLPYNGDFQVADCTDLFHVRRQAEQAKSTEQTRPAGCPRCGTESGLLEGTRDSGFYRDCHHPYHAESEKMAVVR
jgi:hypothetical protein